MSDEQDTQYLNWRDFGDNFGDGTEYPEPPPVVGTPEHPVIAGLLQQHGVDASQANWQHQLAGKLRAPVETSGINAFIDALAQETAATLRSARFTSAPDSDLSLQEVRAQWPDLSPEQREIVLTEVHEHTMDALGLEPWTVEFFLRADPDNPQQQTLFRGQAQRVMDDSGNSVDALESTVRLTTDYILDPDDIVATRWDLFQEREEIVAAPLLEITPITVEQMEAEQQAALERWNEQMEKERARSFGGGAFAKDDDTFFDAQFRRGVRTTLHETGHSIHAGAVSDANDTIGFVHIQTVTHLDVESYDALQAASVAPKYGSAEIGSRLYRAQPREYIANRFAQGVERALFPPEDEP